MVLGMAPKPGPVFYPKYLDISPDESALLLRQLELEAYAGVISALRSQGDLNKEKKALLTEICACLAINEDRHRAEIRRAANDEKLATIALHNSGYESDLEWRKEGRRIVPLPRRPLEITAYMEEADRVAEIIAKENASLPMPSKVNWENFTKSSQKSPTASEEPAEVKVRNSTVTNASFYCAKCLSLQNETMDAATSTEDPMDSEDLNFGTSVPSASDSYVFLPSGTTIHVSTGKAEKEEHDAYSLKPNQAGNFDFGNAPEISLGGRGSKRKRKKSIGAAPATKEGSVTIRQVIRPSSTSTDEFTGGPESEISLPDFQQSRHDTNKPNRPNIKSETKKRQTADDQSRPPGNEQVSKSKRKKPVSQAVTIQHTPVPPEHLYAVGASKKSKQRKMTSAPPEDDESYIPHSRPQPEYTVVSTAQSPTKHLGLYSSRISPLSPSYYPGLASSWSSGTMQREPPLTTESNTSFSRGFHYSPTKPFYRPPGIGQNAYGRSSKPPPSKRHRSSPSSFTFSKKAMSSDVEHQNILQKISGKKDVVPAGKTNADELQKHKAYSGRQSFPGQSGQYSSPGFHPPQAGATFTIPTMESKREQDHPPPQPLPHSSSLEELASVSLMASALNTSSIVETGLAPVSAIVSRVASPAPGQVSSSPSVKKTASRPMMVSRIQNEEGPSVQLPRVGHAITSQASTAFIPARHGSTALGNNPNVPKLKMQGSFSSISGQHPVTHQVRLAVTSSDNGTISSVPINFTSALPLPTISSPSTQGPRVISTIGGKHTLLKPSAPNVITVTAKSLPGVKTSVSSIVSGASIVKPQIGQKTSIIVVHKATGAKGKTMPAAFPTLGAEGSKVITVSTKNLATSDLPRFSAESPEESAPESALGSIQGLVSGLNPMVRKAKVIGKPKFLTMPIKKPISGKIGETTKTKIIQNVIRAPKVLVKAPGSTITTGQLRTIPTGQVVKPVAPSAVLDSPSGGPDIVAAALSQSIGASIVTSNPEGNPVSSPDGPPTANIIKVVSSTPAASTIKAFAATYQKNSSTSQLKPSFAGQSSVTTTSPSFQDKTKVFLATSPSQPKTQPMLFTPNQPQVHRSPQSAPAQKPKPTFPAPAKPNVFPGSGASYLASVGNLAKASIKTVSGKAAYQQTSQQSVMHVKVIGQRPSSPQSQASHQWQAGAVMSKTVIQDKGLDETAAQTKILQDIMDSTSSPQSLSSGGQSHPATSDRATFIYQYHPTPKLVTRPEPVMGIRAPATPISTIDNGDVITLHSISPDTALAGERTDAPKSLTVSKPNLVKISLSSIQSTNSAVEATREVGSLGDVIKQHSSGNVGSKVVENEPQASEIKRDVCRTSTKAENSVNEMITKGRTEEEYV